MRITSVTVVFFSHKAAHFTLDSATPDEFTMTLFFNISNHSLVTSTTTEKTAPIYSIAGAVAKTSSSSQNSYPNNGKKKERKDKLKKWQNLKALWFRKRTTSNFQAVAWNYYLMCWSLKKTGVFKYWLYWQEIIVVCRNR